MRHHPHSPIVLALAALVALSGAIWIRLHPKPTPTASTSIPREALKRDLAWRDGALHFGDETEPFTGQMLDRDPSGNLRARSAVVRGHLHGVCEGWHTNGTLQVREQFRDGISHGLRTKWFPDGTLQSEAPIENGKIHGTFRRWHENGLPAEEIEMRAGVPHGISRLYLPSGALKVLARVENGKVVERQTRKDGEATPAIAAATLPR